jgi:hypothetical protein
MIYIMEAEYSLPFNVEVKNSWSPACVSSIHLTLEAWSLKYRGNFTCYKASSLNNSGLLWDRKVGSGMKRFVG